jgi:anti-sigma B factor antagonist
MVEDLSPFWVEVARDQHEPVVIVHGELDLANGPHLQQRLQDLADSTVGDIVVDLADVRYIDSTGLAALLEASDRLVRTGRRLSVLNPSAQVIRLLEICGVAHLGYVGPLNGDEHRPPAAAPSTTGAFPQIFQAER